LPQDPVPPSGHGNPESSRAVSDYLDLPEIGVVEAYPLDALPLTHRSFTPEEKLALLTEYARVERGQTRQWLHDRHLTSGRMSAWRRVWEQGRLGEGTLPPTVRAPRRLFTVQEKAALVRQFEEARSLGPGEARRWLEAKDLTRGVVTRWQQQLAWRETKTRPRPGHGHPELNPVEVDPAGWAEFPPDARSQPVDTSTGGGESFGLNEYPVDPMDSWWATALASATSTPDAGDAWDAWDQGATGQGAAEPEPHHDGSSSSLWNF
jgi:hypothetical protein